MNRSARLTGVLQILGSGVCFGFLGIFGKQAFDKSVEFGELLSLRFLIASIVVAIWCLFTEKRALKISRKQLLACVVLGAAGYAVFSSFYFLALRGLSVSLAVLLLYLYPVMVTIGAFFAFGERIPRARVVALPIALIGMTCLVWGDFDVEQRKAFWFGVGSAVFYSAYILASSRWLKGVPPLVAAGYTQLFAGLTLAILHLREVSRIVFVLESAWPQFLGLSLVCSVAAMALFLAGLQKLRAWEVSILSLAEPITAVALGILIYGDRMATVQVLGALAVVSALLFVSLPAGQSGTR